MDAFSYLSVLLSIILGLGLTQLFTALGRIIRHRRNVRVHWLPLLWAVVLLVVYVQTWWAMYGLRLEHDWTFLAFATVLAQTGTLYLMAAVLLPEQMDGDPVDLGAYYDEHHRWFFAFFLATIVISVVKDVILSGNLPDRTNLAFHALLAAGCISALIVRRRRFQEFVGVTCAVVFATYIALLFARLH